MKKIFTFGAAAIAIGAAGWAGLWFLGKGEVERRADLELARLEAQGWTITQEARDVEGFPFGYAMSFRNMAAVDVESGVLVRLPDLKVTAEPTAPDQLRFDMPATFEIDIPVSEERRAADATLPKVIHLKGQTEGLAVLAAGAPNAARVVDALADTITVSLDQEDFAGKVLLTLDGFDGGMRRDAADAPSISRLTANVLKVEIEDHGKDEAARTSTADLRYEGFALTAKTDLLTPEALYEAVYGGAEGALDGAFQTGAITTRMTAGGTDDPEGGVFTYSAGSSTGIYDLTSGAIDIQSEARDNQWQMVPNNPESPVSGTVMVEQIQARYSMPMAPTEQPGTMAVRLDLKGLAMDDATWTALDPDGVLEHAPAELMIDLEGTVRVTKRFDQLRPGEAAPFELANLSVNTASINALGASLSAKGDVEMLQPINLPQGKLQVEMSGIKALMEALREADLLPPEMAEMANAMLQVYARPVGQEDNWRTEVTFANDGISVNGLPLQ